MSVKLETDYCPICGAIIGAATNMDDPKGNAKPSPGDVSICSNCTAFLEYDENVRLILMRNETLADMPDDIRIQLIRARHHFEKNMK